MKRIFLVDASSILFRAYYAIKGLSTSYGQRTNAIYGTIKMAQKLLKEFEPEFIAFVFDLPEPTFRHKEYEEYKANREETPPDLQSQIEPTKEILKAMGIPLVEKAGYEADDLIATIAEKVKKDGFEVIIVTADKDLFQLVDEKVKIIHTKKENMILDREQVKEIFGVYPEYVTDVLALMGDAIDNIKGVEGIGEKGAKELVNKFGHIEEIIENIDKIEKKSYRESLRNNIESAIISKKLAIIKRDVPFDIEISDLKIRGRDEEKLKELFLKYEFFSLIEQEKSKEIPHEIILLDEKKLFDLKKHKFVGIEWDRENVYLSDGVSIYCLKRDSLLIKSILELNLITNRLKDLFKEFRELDFQIDRVDDAMISAYLIDPENPKRLDNEVQKVLKNQLSDKPEEISFQLANVAPSLYEEMKKHSFYYLYRDIEIPISKILAEMELRGILIDKEYFKQLSDELTEKINEISQQIYDIVGFKFNISSPKQVGEVLFSKLNLPSTRKTTKTKSYSTETEALEDIYDLHPIIPLILNYRTIMKLKTTYVDVLPSFINPETGKVHTTFNQCVTATGRLSSKDPNLQNIPIKGEYGWKIRRGFISSPKMSFVSADYSQIELRILAHFSEDENLIKAFKEDLDIHTLLASKIFKVEEKNVNEEQRRKAKAVNYSIIYGKGVYGLSRDLRISQKEAKDFLETYFNTFNRVYDFIEEVKNMTLEKGEVSTILGRKRFFHSIRMLGKQERDAMFRQAVNAIIQGSAADLIKKAMVDVRKRLNKDDYIVLQIHDELIIETRDERVETIKSILQEAMENAMSLKVPLKVSVSSGKRWDEI